MKKHCLIISITCLFCARLVAGTYYDYEESFRTYVELHLPYALKYAKAERIPVSICLAQALHESYAGNSHLALRANNHFGLKAADSTAWKGERIFLEDDDYDENGKLKKSAFRKYKTTEDSYRDYARHLKTMSRYAELFKIPVSNYQAWADGLAKAGYATDKNYAANLIAKIEKYELYKYDKEPSPSNTAKPSAMPAHYSTPKPSATDKPTTAPQKNKPVANKEHELIPQSYNSGKTQQVKKDMQVVHPRSTDMGKGWEKPAVAPACPQPAQPIEPMKAKPTFLTVKLRGSDKQD
jgi:hypothetical protein